MQSPELDKIKLNEKFTLCEAAVCQDKNSPHFDVLSEHKERLDLRYLIDNKFNNELNTKFFKYEKLGLISKIGATLLHFLFGKSEYSSLFNNNGYKARRNALKALSKACDEFNKQLPYDGNKEVVKALRARVLRNDKREKILGDLMKAVDAQPIFVNDKEYSEEINVVMNEQRCNVLYDAFNSRDAYEAAYGGYTGKEEEFNKDMLQNINDQELSIQGKVGDGPYNWATAGLWDMLSEEATQSEKNVLIGAKLIQEETQAIDPEISKPVVFLVNSNQFKRDPADPATEYPVEREHTLHFQLVTDNNQPTEEVDIEGEALNLADFDKSLARRKHVFNTAILEIFNKPEFVAQTVMPIMINYYKELGSSYAVLPFVACITSIQGRNVGDEDFEQFFTGKQDSKKHLSNEVQKMLMTVSDSNREPLLQLAAIFGLNVEVPDKSIKLGSASDPNGYNIVGENGEFMMTQRVESFFKAYLKYAKDIQEPWASDSTSKTFRRYVKQALTNWFTDENGKFDMLQGLEVLSINSHGLNPDLLKELSILASFYLKNKNEFSLVDACANITSHDICVNMFGQATHNKANHIAGSMFTYKLEHGDYPNLSILFDDRIGNFKSLHNTEVDSFSVQKCLEKIEQSKVMKEYLIEDYIRTKLNTVESKMEVSPEMLQMSLTKMLKRAKIGKDAESRFALMINKALNSDHIVHEFANDNVKKPFDASKYKTPKEVIYHTCVNTAIRHLEKFDQQMDSEKMDHEKIALACGNVLALAVDLSINEESEHFSDLVKVYTDQINKFSANEQMRFISALYKSVENKNTRVGPKGFIETEFGYLQHGMKEKIFSFLANIELKNFDADEERQKIDREIDALEKVDKSAAPKDSAGELNPLELAKLAKNNLDDFNKCKEHFDPIMKEIMNEIDLTRPYKSNFTSQTTMTPANKLKPHEGPLTPRSKAPDNLGGDGSIRPQRTR